MHSFDNSANSKRKANNWYLIGQFLKKEELGFVEDDYKTIKDNDFEALNGFIRKLYTILTKRA